MILVRAHNEEKNISYVIKEIQKTGLPLALLDSASTDRTSEYAAELNADIVAAPLGLGAATVYGLRFFKNFPILFVDGDLTYVHTDALCVLHKAAEHGFVGKGVFDKAGRSSSLIGDLASEAGVPLPNIPLQALTSAYSAYPAFFADVADLSVVPKLRGSDLTLSLLVDKIGLPTTLVPVGPRFHNNKRGASHIDNLVESNRKALVSWSEMHSGSR